MKFTEIVCKIVRDIIEQVFFRVNGKDNFATYPYLHTAYGVPILIKAVENCLNGKLRTDKKPNDLPSKLRHHPAVGNVFIILSERM